MIPSNTCLIRALGVAGLCCLFVACAAAIAVLPPAGQVRPGEQVTVDVRDIPDNATFQLLITGTFTVTPGGEFSFAAENFQLPFSLVQSQIRANLQNTELNSLSVKKGDLEVRKTGRSTGGLYATAENVNISSGIYDYMKLSGTALPEADRVIANLELTGKKVGADSGTISFTVGGFQYGTVDISALVDGNPILSTTVAVVPTATPTPASGSGTYIEGSIGGTPITTKPSAPATTAVPPANKTVTGTTAGTIIPTSTPTAEQTPLPTTVAGSPTKAAMSVLPLLGLVISAVFLANRTRK
jgi:hypothetical protein